MKTILLADIVQIPVDDPVAFTFFLGSRAMLAASVFFFFERSSVSPKWKTSLLVSALITGIAAIHYFYMRDYYAATGANPTALRYIDWILTVPLIRGWTPTIARKTTTRRIPGCVAVAWQRAPV